MATFEDREAVASKVDWEGGVDGAIEYGLKHEDMPEGDDELREAWKAAELAHRTFSQAAEKVSELLPSIEF